jgi:hypothetical protein
VSRKPRNCRVVSGRVASRCRSEMKRVAMPVSCYGETGCAPTARLRSGRPIR